MSDNYIVMYSPAAQEDVRSIFSYIAYELQAEQAAKGQVKRIRDIIRKLEVMPDRYAVMEREPWKSMGMRKLPVDNYIVFYIVLNFFPNFPFATLREISFRNFMGHSLYFFHDKISLSGIGTYKRRCIP